MIHLFLTTSFMFPAMPTSKKRINISLSDDLEHVLKRLAARDDVPQATKAIELLKIGIEVEEDDLWNAFAEERDTPDARFVSHKKAWR